jgi:hypothetical protein
MRFSTRVSDHIRSNVVGYIALFCFAIGGTAYATHPGGANTISSADIINGEVKNNDLGADSVATGKIDDGQVQGADLAASSVTSGKVADNSLTKTDLGLNSVGSFELDGDAFLPEDIKAQYAGLSKDYGIPPNAIQSDEISNGSVGSSEVATDSLQGEDINESTLTALDGHDTFDDLCDPHTTSFIICEELTFTVGRRMPVLTMFNYGFGSGSGDEPNGICRTTLDGAESSPDIGLWAPIETYSEFGGTPLVNVLTLNAGTHTIGLSCLEWFPDDSDIEIRDISLAAVELGID